MSAADFPAKLKAAREAAGLSQQEAADRAGSNQPLWVLYENGERDPGLQTAERLAGAVGKKLKQLV